MPCLDVQIASLSAAVLRSHHAGASPDQEIAQAVSVARDVRQNMTAAPARQQRWFPILLIADPRCCAQHARSRDGHSCLKGGGCLSRICKGLVHRGPLVSQLALCRRMLCRRMLCRRMLCRRMLCRRMLCRLLLCWQALCLEAPCYQALCLNAPCWQALALRVPGRSCPLLAS